MVIALIEKLQEIPKEDTEDSGEKQIDPLHCN